MADEAGSSAPSVVCVLPPPAKPAAVTRGLSLYDPHAAAAAVPVSGSAPLVRAGSGDSVDSTDAMLADCAAAVAAQRAARGASDVMIDTDATERLLAAMHDEALSVPGGDGAAASGDEPRPLPKRRRLGLTATLASPALTRSAARRSFKRRLVRAVADPTPRFLRGQGRM